MTMIRISKDFMVNTEFVVRVQPTFMGDMTVVTFKDDTAATVDTPFDDVSRLLNEKWTWEYYVAELERRKQQEKFNARVAARRAAYSSSPQDAPAEQYAQAGIQDES